MLIYTIAWEHTNIHVCTWALTHKHLYINTHAHAILHVTKQTTKEFSLSIEKAPTSVSTRIKKVHLNSINCNPSSTKPSFLVHVPRWSRSSYIHTCKFMQHLWWTWYERVVEVDNDSIWRLCKDDDTNDKPRRNYTSNVRYHRKSDR